MEVIFLKTEPQQNEFTDQLRSYTAKELVEAYNRQVGNRGWVSAKGRFLIALYHEFKRRNIDISIIDTGSGMRLNLRVELNPSGNRLIPINTG